MQTLSRLALFKFWWFDNFSISKVFVVECRNLTQRCNLWIQSWMPNFSSFAKIVPKLLWFSYICGFCSENLHPGSPSQQTFCTPCNNDSHPSFSRTCPKFLEEQEITNSSVNKNIFYFAAKKGREKTNNLSE